MENKIVEWIKQSRYFIVFAKTGRASEDKVKDTKKYNFQLNIEYLIKEDDTRNVFMEYYPKKGIIKVSLQSYALSSKSHIEFITDDQELIDILNEVLLPYKQHTFNIVYKGLMVKIDDEEDFRFVKGIDYLCEDLLTNAADEAIPEIKSFIKELRKKVEKENPFYVKATLKLEYINEYMFIEIIKL